VTDWLSLTILRQTPGQVRATAGNLSSLCPQRVSFLFSCHARLAEGKALPEKSPEKRTGNPGRQPLLAPIAVYRTSPVPRGLGLFSQSLSPGCGQNPLVRGSPQPPFLRYCGAINWGVPPASPAKPLRREDFLPHSPLPTPYSQTHISRNLPTASFKGGQVASPLSEGGGWGGIAHAPGPLRY